MIFLMLKCQTEKCESFFAIAVSVAPVGSSSEDKLNMILSLTVVTLHTIGGNTELV